MSYQSIYCILCTCTMLDTSVHILYPVYVYYACHRTWWVTRTSYSPCTQRVTTRLAYLILTNTKCILLRVIASTIYTRTMWGKLNSYRYYTLKPALRELDLCVIVFMAMLVSTAVKKYWNMIGIGSVVQILYPGNVRTKLCNVGNII